MRVALGSASEDKKKILSEALANFDTNIQIKCVNVSSEIVDQPLDKQTTIRGAINRAKNALRQEQEADFSVGLEGGIEEIKNHGFFLICVAALYNKEGKIYLGIGSQLEIPRRVANKVREGESFGVVIREYEKKHVGDKGVKVVTQTLISRKEPFSEAIKNAYLCYRNVRHY